MTSGFLGEASSLGAALLWAIAVTLFRPAIQAYGARAVNLVKCALATALLGGTAWGLGSLGPTLAAPAADLGWLALSGLVGLTLGDTALFAAVSRVGPHRSLLLQTLAPVFTLALAAGLQGERLGRLELLGGLLVLAGVFVVVGPVRRRDPAVPRPGPALMPGLLLGVVAAAGQGVGIVLAKAGMVHVDALPGAFVRMGAGTAGLLVVAAVGGHLARAARLAREGRTVARVAPATFLGTYLAMILMMTGIAHAPASIAAVLLATPPVFSLVLEAALGRERITARPLLGTLVAVVGVALLTVR